MKIALDVDGVLADFMRPAQTYAHVMSNRKLTEDEIVHYDMSKVWPEIKDEMRAQWRARGFCASLHILPGSQIAVEILNAAFGKQNIKYVTTPMSDSQFWIDERTAWLKHHFDIDSDKIIYTSDKVKDDQESDILVDDHPDNVTKWAESGRKSFLITQPFNATFEIPNLLPILRMKDLYSTTLYLLSKVYV
jgi:5'(3')-deoxyribonucleotidase